MLLETNQVKANLQAGQDKFRLSKCDISPSSDLTNSVQGLGLLASYGRTVLVGYRGVFMGCKGTRAMAVHYHQINLHHWRENNRRFTVTVGTGFLAAYSNKNIFKIIKSLFLSSELFLIFFLLGWVIIASSQEVRDMGWKFWFIFRITLMSLGLLTVIPQCLQNS